MIDDKTERVRDIFTFFSLRLREETQGCGCVIDNRSLLDFLKFTILFQRKH